MEDVQWLVDAHILGYVGIGFRDDLGTEQSLLYLLSADDLSHEPLLPTVALQKDSCPVRIRVLENIFLLILQRYFDVVINFHASLL